MYERELNRRSGKTRLGDGLAVRLAHFRKTVCSTLCFVLILAVMNNSQVCAWQQEILPGESSGQSTNEVEADFNQQMLPLRMESIGLGFVCVFGLVLLLFAYFRLNHATRGVYSRRLQMLAILIAMLLVVGCAGLLIVIWR